MWRLLTAETKGNEPICGRSLCETSVIHYIHPKEIEGKNTQVDEDEDQEVKSIYQDQSAATFEATQPLLGFHESFTPFPGVHLVATCAPSCTAIYIQIQV